MIASDNVLTIIRDFESLKLKAYLCPANVWTIGYGHTEDVRPYDKITLDQAEYYLLTDLVRVEQAIHQAIHVPLTQGQYDALVSFVFNCGIAAFKASTLLKKINARDYDGAADEFERWNLAAGKIQPGLERRRKLEKQLFSS